MPSAAFMFNEEINGDLQLFQQLCAGCYGRLFYTKQQKKMTFQRPSQSLELIIQEWWAFQNDTIWHHDLPCTFELFKEYHSREYIIKQTYQTPK